MKIKIVSDLHLELSPININNNENCDVLILAGDIIVAAYLNQNLNQDLSNRFRSFLTDVSSQFPHVIYIAGNHEFYQGDWNETIQHLRNECSNYPNIYFMENDSKEISDVVFIGATLWTSMNNSDQDTIDSIKTITDDFSSITNQSETLTVNSVITRNQESVNYFLSELDKNREKKCVMVTHHAPHLLGCPPRFRKNFVVSGGAYFSDQTSLIVNNPQISLWAHGHTHRHLDYRVSNIRMICNPRGYQSDTKNQTTDWDQELTVEI